MTDASDCHEEPQPIPKKLNLSDLLPVKVAVETSLGPLYVRHVNAKDWEHFVIDDAQELGRAVVTRLTSRIEDKKNNDSLTEEDVKLLDAADLHALVASIAMRNNWEMISVGAGLTELGEAAKAAKVRAYTRHKEMLAGLHKSIDSSYGFLAKGPLEKLQEQMASLADIRGPLHSAQSLAAAIRASTPAGDALNGATDIRSAINRATNDIKSINISRDRDFTRIPEFPSVQMPPRLEDTLLGRATLDGAKNSLELVQRMGALVDIIAGLNQTMVEDVFPASVKKAETDQQNAKKAFQQAAKALRWTQVAVALSVLVTAMSTWWQVSVAKQMDLVNSEQQKRLEVVLESQLATQQKLLEILPADAAAMRAAIAELKPLPPVENRKK